MFDEKEITTTLFVKKLAQFRPESKTYPLMKTLMDTKEKESELHHGQHPIMQKESLSLKLHFTTDISPELFTHDMKKQLVKKKSIHE